MSGGQRWARMAARSPGKRLQCASIHPGGNPGANLKSISHRCHLREVAFVWKLTKETIYLPRGCLRGGYGTALGGGQTWARMAARLLRKGLQYASVSDTALCDLRGPRPIVTLKTQRFNFQDATFRCVVQTSVPRTWNIRPLVISTSTLH